MATGPKKIQACFEKMKSERNDTIQLRMINDKFYVAKIWSVWDQGKKKSVKKGEHLGTITDAGIFIPNRCRSSIPFTSREIFEYGNVQLAYESIKDIQPALEKFTPFANDLIAAAIVKVIHPLPLKLLGSKWERFHLSRTINVHRGNLIIKTSNKTSKQFQI